MARLLVARKQLVPLSEIEHLRAYVTAKFHFARYLIHEGAYVRIGWSGDALAYAQFFNGLPVLQKRRETRALHARRRALDVQSLRSNWLGNFLAFRGDSSARLCCGAAGSQSSRSIAGWLRFFTLIQNFFRPPLCGRSRWLKTRSSGLMRQAHVQGQGAQVIAFIASEQKRTELIAELS
jgi:hypothetical protein